MPQKSITSKPLKPELVYRKVSKKRRDALTKLLRASMDKKWYTISELAKDSDISIPGTMKALGYLVEREFLEQRFESGNLSDNGISARVRHEFLLNEEGTRYAEQSLQYYSDCESYETLKRSKRKAAFA